MKNLRCLYNVLWHMALKVSHIQCLSRQHIIAGLTLEQNCLPHSQASKEEATGDPAPSMNGFTALKTIHYVSRAEESTTYQYHHIVI